MRRSNTIGLSLCLCFCLLAPPPSMAHETTPPNWCLDPGTSPQIVETFQFGYRDLMQLKDLLGLEYDSEVPDDQKCGIVDNWHMAQRIAQDYCAQFAPRGLSPTPILSGPSSFTDDDHHALYSLGEGLTGSCGVCVPSRGT